MLAACSGSEDEGFSPPECGSNVGRPGALLAENPDLDALADRHDRLWHAVHAHATGLNADFTLNERSDVDVLTQFVESGEHDFAAVTGKDPAELGVWHKTAGLYGGVGLAADAYQYGVLRDSGAACADVERARAHLVRGLEGFDIAARINGVPGVMVRGLVNTELPFAGAREPTPLFDENGNPLPEEKNNGEWRSDQSGAYPLYRWEDSLSRDMLVGWAMAFGAVWEVIREDPTIDAGLKARIQENARDTGRALMKVGAEGYDLEIPDADGRLTFHAYMHESAIDRIYIEGARNGFNAVMSLGIVAALAYCAEDPELAKYLEEELIVKRDLAGIAADDLLFVNVGVGSNFSNYNMAFTGMFLAQRYVRHEGALTKLRVSLRHELYEKDGAEDRQPVDMGQTFFDYIYAAGDAAAHVDHVAEDPFDQEAIARGTQTLLDYPAAPYFDRAVENCDADEIASGVCTLRDGTEVRVLGEVGWNDSLVVDKIVPMAVRPPSNYHWRSPPYRPNGGNDSGHINPAVDFRVAYWLGRWVR